MKQAILLITGILFCSLVTVESNNIDCSSVRCACGLSNGNGNKCCKRCTGSDQGCGAKYKDGKIFVNRTDFCWCDEGVVMCVDKPKMGACPEIEEDTAGICISECTKDNECDGTRKCCKNGCGGTVCTQPDIGNTPCTKQLINGKNDPCTKCKCVNQELMCYTYACIACEYGHEPIPSGQCCGSCKPSPDQ